MEINPFVITLIGMFARAGVFMLAGALGIGPAVHAFADAHTTEFDQVLAAVVIAVLTALYAAYKQYVRKQILVTALASPVPMSEADAKALVKDPSVITPSVTTRKDEVPQ